MTQTPSNDQVIGTMIDGKYRVDALLGQGGMGKVFRVMHLQLNKEFALKLMDFDKADADTNLVLRFKREAEVLAKIAHPNIVMVTDFGVLEGGKTPYIVMEYIEGFTLRQMLKKQGKLSEKQAIYIGKQLCAGLHEAHLQGVIHRDLKPENVMVKQFSDGEIMARVLDFGIAKILQKSDEIIADNLTGNDVPGTMRYMAPEQMLSQPVDARVDIFGICLIIYEMLTATVPAVVVSKPKPITNLRPDVSEKLNKVILRGLAHSPDDRPQTALDLKRELEQIENPDASSAINPSLLLTSADRNIEGVKTSSNQAAATVSNQDRLNNINNLSINNLNQANTSIATTPPPVGSMFWKLVATVTLTIILLGGGGYGAWQYLAPKPQEAAMEQSALPDMRPVKDGNFMMGNNKGLDIYAKPEYPVKVDAFQVSRFLVTNRQYGEFVKRTNHRSPSGWNGNTPPSQILEEPVYYVSYSDAIDYCNWLTTVTGKNYRLLTEPEWEYIARSRLKYNISQTVEIQHSEWTSTKFMLYPGSKEVNPALKAGVTIRVGRGPIGLKESDEAPETFRQGYKETDILPVLGFRIACNDCY